MRVVGRVLFLLAAGCGEPPPPPPLPVSANPPASTVAASTRLRERSYFAANEHGSCVVYWVEHEQRSVGKEIPCPREIERDERLRLTGRTCIRESAQPERNLPVRCPKEVFYVERDDARTKGEFKLGPQK